MPTYYPTGSHAPSTTTITPTYTPTATGSPSPLMEGPTTEAPTYAPITYRPTLFPTSSIREPKVPTRSPAPTIASAPPPPPNNHPKRKRVNRQCSHQNCDNRVVQGGVCVTHGTRRKCCAHPGCEKSVRHSGYCSAHGPSWQNATMPTPMMTTTMEAAAGTEEERGGDNNATVIHHEVPPPHVGTTDVGVCSSSNGLQSNDLRLPSGVSKLCHYPPLIHSCGSRGSSCCAATVSTTHCLNCQPTLNDVSSSSKAWSHVYSQRKSNCSRCTQCASVAYSTDGISSSVRHSRSGRAKKKLQKQQSLLREVAVSLDKYLFASPTLKMKLLFLMW